MTNITSLQAHLQKFNFDDSSQTIRYVGIFGSGMSTVFKDLSNQTNEDLYVFTKFNSIGKLESNLVMYHIVRSILEAMNKRGWSKLKPSDISGNENFYSLLGTLKLNFETFNKQNRIVLIMANIETLVEELDTYFFEALKELTEVENENGDKPFKIAFIQEKFLEDSVIFEKTGSLVENFYGATEYVSGFTVEEIDEVLEPITASHTEVSKKIMSLTAGNPKMVDRILDIIAKHVEKSKTFSEEDIDSDEIVRDSKIEYILYNIWKNMSSHQKNILLGIDDKRGREFDYLENSNVIEVEDGRVKSNLIIIRSYLSYKSHNVAVKKSEGKVQPRFNTDKLSTQEYDVYELFMKKPDKLISKEEIAKVMGIDKKKRKRQDWAIDQLMKRLRTKIGDKGGKVIQTIRGRGYKMKT